MWCVAKVGFVHKLHCAPWLTYLAFNSEVDGPTCASYSTLWVSRRMMVFPFRLVNRAECFCASVTKNLHCQRLSVYGYVHPSVSMYVRKTLWAPYLRNRQRQIHPILVTGVFAFVGLLIRFWGKGQFHSRQRPKKPGEYNIFVTIGANFPKIRLRVYLGLETHWLGFRVKRSKVKVTAGWSITSTECCLVIINVVEEVDIVFPVIITVIKNSLSGHSDSCVNFTPILLLLLDWRSLL